MLAVSGRFGILTYVVFVILFVVPPAGANLFVSSNLTNQVLEYEGTTGAFISPFFPAGNGGLDEPQGLAFGPNGNLFVSSLSGQVLEYGGTTGTFIGPFVSAGSGGLAFPTGLVFGPNRNLFVSSFSIETNQVLEYDGTTGAFVTAFVLPICK
jgi:DNA-binding beta-propeller fold protein YncE